VVVGDEVTVTRTTGAEEDYGRWIIAKVSDKNIATVAQANEVGDNFLAEQASQDTLACTVRQPGLRAGQSVTFVNAARSLNGAYEIKRVTILFEGGAYAVWKIEMGKYIPTLPELIADMEQGGTSGGNQGRNELEELIKIEQGELDTLDGEVTTHIANYDAHVVIYNAHKHGDGTLATDTEAAHGHTDTLATNPEFHTHAAQGSLVASDVGSEHQHSVYYDATLRTGPDGNGTAHDHGAGGYTDSMSGAVTGTSATSAPNKIHDHAYRKLQTSGSSVQTQAKGHGALNVTGSTGSTQVSLAGSIGSGGAHSHQVNSGETDTPS
jgi:hypothetical protein